MGTDHRPDVEYFGGRKMQIADQILLNGFHGAVMGGVAHQIPLVRVQSAVLIQQLEESNVCAGHTSGLAHQAHMAVLHADHRLDAQHGARKGFRASQPSALAEIFQVIHHG